MPAYSCQRRRIESANAKALWNSGDMVMDPHASGNESNDHEPEVWPDGPIAPLRPLVLTGVKSLAFYLVNLLFLSAVVLPILAVEPFALWGLDCFLHRNPSLVALRIPLGLVIVFILILSASSVILLFLIWMYRKWLDRLGQDEFTVYLFHDRLQRMGTIGLKPNAFLLRQARK